MAEQSPPNGLLIDYRREIFRALVESQDGGLSVEASRAEMATRYGITEAVVRRIEREGMEKDWPPL